MRYLNTLSLLTALSLFFSGCAIYHHYGPYYGKIVDEETKQPLEGVVVLANYYTWLWGSPGGPSVYFLDAQEVVTDKNGEFMIPSLNAVAFRPISTFESNPEFMIFKSGYKCGKPVILEEQYGQIELKKLISQEERIANHCYPTNVPKKKINKFIQLLNVERMNIGLEPY